MLRRMISSVRCQKHKFELFEFVATSPEIWRAFPKKIILQRQPGAAPRRRERHIDEWFHRVMAFTLEFPAALLFDRDATGSF